VNREKRSYTHSIDNKQYRQYLRITSGGKIQTVFGVDVGGGVLSLKKGYLPFSRTRGRVFMPIKRRYITLKIFITFS
jgi:hypothetical protein